LQIIFGFLSHEFLEHPLPIFYVHSIFFIFYVFSFTILRSWPFWFSQIDSRFNYSNFSSRTLTHPLPFSHFIQISHFLTFFTRHGLVHGLFYQ
jgi:hypothetical protein